MKRAAVEEDILAFDGQALAVVTNPIRVRKSPRRQVSGNAVCNAPKKIAMKAASDSEAKILRTAGKFYDSL